MSYVLKVDVRLKVATATDITGITVASSTEIAGISHGNRNTADPQVSEHLDGGYFVFVNHHPILVQHQNIHAQKIIGEDSVSYYTNIELGRIALPITKYAYNQFLSTKYRIVGIFRVKTFTNSATLRQFTRVLFANCLNYFILFIIHYILVSTVCESSIHERFLLYGSMLYLVLGKN